MAEVGDRVAIEGLQRGSSFVCKVCGKTQVPDERPFGVVAHKDPPHPIDYIICADCTERNEYG